MNYAPNAWDLQGSESKARDDSLRLTEIVLFIPTALLGLRVTPAVAVPMAEVASVVMVVVALFRPPTRDLRIPQWFMACALALGAVLLVSAQVNGVINVRRLGHIVVVVALAMVLASGRVHARSACAGMAIGVPIGVTYGLIFFGQSTYAGRLTGIMGDPNSAGMAIVIVGCLALAGLRKRWHQVVLVVLCLGGLWLTFSRTSLLAAAIVGAWVVIGRRLGPAFGAVALLGVMQFIVWFPDEWKLEGPFAARDGSDDLRERIAAQEAIDVARSPWIGNGPGTASVELDGEFFFYHSSFLALRAEAGWIGLAIFISLAAGVLWYLAGSADRRRTVWFEAALIGGLVCAMNLGEVLLATPMWVALGLAVREAAATRGDSGEKAPDDKRLDHLLASGPYAGLTTRSS